MPSKKLVLVTGASGFLGSQVVDHLLRDGSAVRGTSRSEKVDQLQKNYSHPEFEVTVVDDLVKGDFTAALKGVGAVIHVASPLPQGGNHLEVAIEGTLNLLRQAHAAKVYKVIIISSYASAFTSSEEMLDASHVINDKDWNRVTRDEALKPGLPPLQVYAASKALAERAAWDFVESHPEIDLITLLPAFIYGPLAPAQVVTDPKTSLSTNGWLYMLIAGPAAAYPPAVLPQAVDVRDVARAAVLSLKTQPPQPGERRRILLWGGTFTWKQAIKHIAAAKPELKARLVGRGEPSAEQEAQAAGVDTSMAGEVLGLNEFIGWKQTVEDTVDSLLKREPTWTN